MEMQYFKEYSPALGREMECKVYGHGGRPMLYIPCQDGRFFDFEDFHMADTLAPWIESGQLMVMSIDTLDKETWSDTNGDPYWRIRRYEQWLHYIVDEAVPKLRYLSKERNGWDDLPGVIISHAPASSPSAAASARPMRSTFTSAGPTSSAAV